MAERKEQKLLKDPEKGDSMKDSMKDPKRNSIGGAKAKLTAASDTVKDMDTDTVIKISKWAQFANAGLLILTGVVRLFAVKYYRR